MRKAAEGRADEINTCIGCNQACLDHTFKGKVRKQGMGGGMMEGRRLSCFRANLRAMAAGGMA